GTSLADAQIGRQMALLNSPAYESAAQPLRGAPPRQYNFSKAVLGDVMRLMAEDAGISFFGLPDGNEGSDALVTFTINASPFVALETLAKANGVSLIFENGIWYLRPANDQELIGRIYEINYNAQEIVTKNTQSGLSGSSVAGSGGSRSGGLSGSGGLNLQGAPDYFVIEPSRILEDIQNILDIPTTGSTASFAPTASVDNVAQLSLGSLPGVPSVVSSPSQRLEAGADDGSAQSKVIWNSDSNTLYVVATRQQHQWIEAYLASADRPQPMIAVEVKFIETSRDPSTTIGIDWDGALGENGLDVTLSEASGPINLDSVGGYSLPTAVLSYSDLNWSLRAIYNDSKAKAISFPRMVTLDNREVAFRSVINQPVLGSSSSASLGAGATETSAIEYLPIGTVINILPKMMAGGKILLNVSLTVSDIVGTEIINGNPFPIATSRVYSAPLTVKSGYTVAISGLDAARQSDSERGVPILGRLPVVGYAFKNRRKDRSRQHLMMLITPIALNGATEGLTKKPITQEPWKRNYNEGKAPAYEGEPRTNADLYPDPITEVPHFESSANSRKANGTFGRVEPIVARPVEAEVEEREVVGVVPAAQPASAEKLVISDPVPDALNTPMTVEPLGEELADAGNRVEVAAAPSVETSEEATPEPTPESAPMAKSEIAEIKKGISKIQDRLGSVPSGEAKLSVDDAQLVVNAHDEARRLLGRVDEIRGEKTEPLQGELGDAWWDLINLKSRATKISQRSPESLVIGND
ncbi:MAG: hypothetical protein AAGC68_13040, partial [Verrucomicrobiota bacterium]